MDSADSRPGDITSWPGVEPARYDCREIAESDGGDGRGFCRGNAFFRPGRGDDMLRFCFAKIDAELDEACERLRKVYRPILIA